MNLSLIYTKPNLKPTTKMSVLRKYTIESCRAAQTPGKFQFATRIRKRNVSHLVTARPSVDLNVTETMACQSGRLWTKSELLETIERALEESDKDFTDPDKPGTAAEKLYGLGRKNRLMRHHLRTLNELLSALLPFKNDELYRRKRTPQTAEANKSETGPLLAQNCEKWLEYYKVEFEHYAKRIAQVKDPAYLQLLKDTCVTLDEEIARVQRQCLIRIREDRLYRYVHFRRLTPGGVETVEGRKGKHRGRGRQRGANISSLPRCQGG